MNPLGSYGPDPIIGGEGGPSWENVSYTPGDPPIRYIESGVAYGVPETSVWVMMLAGFAVLGLARPRRARAVDWTA